jgi:hypothetical protein
MNIPTNDFRTITLEEMDNIRLMDRIDSKYVASENVLPELLERMLPLFKIQTIENKTVAEYGTQYIDTDALDFYNMHQNGKLNRQKIRIRSYLDSARSFLEVKNKSNKGRTSKKRVETAFSRITAVSELHDGLQFLESNSLFPCSRLKPVMENAFRRMTFVNNSATERITIDTGLKFKNYITDREFSADKLVVLELKQDGRSISDFREILTDMRIHTQSFSKYCTGIYLTDPSVKSNRIKPKWIIINKKLQ